MSDAIVRRFKGFVAAIPSSTWEKARKYGAVAVATGIGWSLVVALMSWLSSTYGWSTTEHWSEPWLEGLASIAALCGTCFGVSVTSTTAAHGVGSVNGAAAQPDRLEVRGLSWMLGKHVNAEAWRILTSNRPDEGVKLNVEDRAPVEYGGPVLFGPLTQAFSRIAGDLPRNVPVPLLVWPERPDGKELRDLTLAAKESRNYGLSYSPQSAAADGEDLDAVGAAFSLFDAQPDLSYLLVLSSDGPGFRSDALPGVAPNVSFILLARPQSSGQAQTLQRSQGPGMLADGSALLGFVHRPRRLRLSGDLSHVTSKDLIKETWMRATKMIPECKSVGRALLAGAGSSKLRPIFHELIHASSTPPDGIDRVIDVTDSKPSLGTGSSVGWLSYAIEAMIESESVVAIAATVTNRLSITLVSTRAGCGEEGNA
jgi:hypothetical protein